QWFGWNRGNVIDLGDITAARAAEMFLPLWVRLYGLLGTPHFNINVVGGRPGVGRARRPRPTEEHAGPRADAERCVHALSGWVRRRGSRPRRWIMPRSVWFGFALTLTLALAGTAHAQGDAGRV